MNLIRYEAARTALAEAHRVDEVKDLRDKAEAMAAYARQARDTELVQYATEIKVRAERRCGELLRDSAENGERNTGGKPSNDTTVTVLADLGITRDQSSRYQKLAAMPDEQFEVAIATAKENVGEVTTAFMLRMAGKRDRKAAVAAMAEAATMKTSDLGALSARGMKFGTILADPPWLYGNQSTRGATSDHYSGMTVDEIAALPIAELAADSAHLHFWTTNAFLFESKRIMEAWGFEYRSCYVWVKPQIGMGNYWRVSHEFMLLGIRGSCPFADRSLKSWGEFSRGKHSAKPDQIRSLIEKASPGPRLELFGRRPAPGWVVWGNEIARTVFDASVEELVA